MMRELLKKSLNLCFLLILASCSASAPIIRESKWKITIVQDKDDNSIYEKLSIFLNCYDDDGENDIETIFFIDDDNGLYWELDDSSWDIKYIDEVKWLGSSSIVMPDRSNIPRVAIRTLVRDLAGESTEDTIYITKSYTDFEKIVFPELVINDGFYSIYNYEHGLIQVVADGQIILEDEITNTPETFEIIFNKNREDFNNELEFYLTVNDGDLDITSGPWY